MMMELFHQWFKENFDKGQNDKNMNDFFSLTDNDVENFGTGKKEKEKMIQKLFIRQDTADKKHGTTGMACLFSISGKNTSKILSICF